MADVRLAVSLGVRADVMPCTNSKVRWSMVGWGSKKEVQREKQKVAQEKGAEGKAGVDSKEEVGHGKKKARGGKAKRQKENVETAEDSDADASVLVERAVKRRKRNRTKK